MNSDDLKTLLYMEILLNTTKKQRNQIKKEIEKEIKEEFNKNKGGK